MNRKIAKALHDWCMETFGVQPDETLMLPLLENLDEQLMFKYFGESGTWKGSRDGAVKATEHFGQTGMSLIDKVNALNPESVLDVGCGYNLFKDKIQNLWGIDPYNTNADENVGIMEFQPEKEFDVVLALGSINFGSEESIYYQTLKLVSMCKEGGHIFLRVNPGVTHNRPGAEWIDFFEWSPEKLSQAATRCNCEMVELAQDRETNGNGIRFYAHWVRRGELGI